MKTKIQKVGVHVMLVIAFFASIYFFTPEEELNRDWISQNPHEMSLLVTYLLLVVLFYLHYYWFLPNFYFQRKFIPYFFALALSFVFVFFFPNQIFWERILNKTPNFRAMDKPPMEMGKEMPPQKPDFDDFPPPPPHDKPDFMRKKPMHGPFGKFDFAKTFSLFLIGIFFTYILRSSQKNAIIEKQKLSAELSLLQLQISPHFLFNSLNTIYSLAIEEKAKRSTEAIANLSGMMRYITVEGRQEYVQLNKEINYIENYVRMQKLRFGETLELDFEVIGQPLHHKIHPLILILFIENAFKYGVNPEENSKISIKIQIIANDLTLHVVNRKVRFASEESMGVGIENVKNRIEILYPNKHQLRIDDSPETYGVTLSLNMS